MTHSLKDFQEISTNAFAVKSEQSKVVGNTYTAKKFCGTFLNVCIVNSEKCCQIAYRYKSSRIS